MLATAASSSPISLWYLTRGTGVATLVLLTVVVALGVANVKRLTTPRLPRFVVDGLHRNAALLAVVFLAIHVITSLADSYVSISLVSAVVPFSGSYKSFWVGLGALSLDLVAAIVVTSLLRRRIGYRAWRATHWLAYASWPVALLHSLGTGTDAGSSWMLALAALSVITVAAAVALRLRGDYSSASPTTPVAGAGKPRRPPAWSLTPAGGHR